MKNYNVHVSLSCDYLFVEAENEDDAINQALEWFAECAPNYKVEESEEDYGEDFSIIDDDCGFDPYMGCYTDDC